MKKDDYPKITVILRGVTIEQADLIICSMIELQTPFAVEVTLNTEHALKIINNLSSKYGHQIYIGAGTVRNILDANSAIDAGAEFLLGPHMFSEDIMMLCKERKVISVPSAMTPSEVNLMFAQGADIVKIFPASVVSPKFFKDIQGPFGELDLMAVGGISADNIQDYFENGAKYVGVGSSMFKKSNLETLNKEGIKSDLEKYLNIMVKG